MGLKKQPPGLTNVDDSFFKSIYGMFCKLFKNTFLACHFDQFFWCLQCLIVESYFFFISVTWILAKYTSLSLPYSTTSVAQFAN